MKSKRIFPMLLAGLSLLVLLGLVLYSWYISTRAQVVIEWSTASELDTVGFNLYRSETSSGNGVQVNNELIPPAKDSQTGGNYRYVDSNVLPGRVYYYYLEDISTNGATNTNGPVVVKAQTAGKMIWFLLAVVVTVTSIWIYFVLRPRQKNNRIEG